MKKVIFIIAQKGFQDTELFTPLKILKNGGIHAVVASIVKKEALGSKGGSIHPDIAVKDADIKEFDALIMIGGPGCPALALNEDIMTFVRNMKSAGKLICGICIAPMVLAQAGVLTYKNATVFQTEESLQAFSDNAVHCSDEDVVVDEYAITANGPDAAEKFGNVILQHLS